MAAAQTGSAAAKRRLPAPPSVLSQIIHSAAGIIAEKQNQPSSHLSAEVPQAFNHAIHIATQSRGFCHPFL